MKSHRILIVLASFAGLAASLAAQTATTPTTSSPTTTLPTTTTTGTTSTTDSTQFAPLNFGNFIMTSTPSNATSSVGISSIFGSDGTTATFGTGGALVNPADFDYTVTSPTTAVLNMPASETSPASTTELTFTSATEGTFVTTAGSDTTEGAFQLAEIPGAAALANVSVRTNLSSDETATLGFVVDGAMPRRVLIRAVGSGLTTFGVNGALANPSVTVFRGIEAIATNDDWETEATMSATLSARTELGATSALTNGVDELGPDSDNESTGTLAPIVVTADPDNGADSGAGLETEAEAEAETTVDATLATPEVFAQVGAFGLAERSRDSALVVTLSPGAYTATVQASSPSGGDTGSGDDTGAGAGGTGGGTSGGTGGTGGANAGEVLFEVYFIE